MTQEEKDYVNSLIILALTVNTDEIEGQLIIDLSILNLCAVDQEFSYIPDDINNQTIEDFIDDINNDEDIKKILDSTPEDLPDIIKDIHTDKRVIIEFASATVLDPNPVTYKITVQPGLIINNDTIIGYVEQEGQMKEIYSRWEHATVMSTSDGKDFFHLYPDTCNRHIVLTDCLSGSGKTIDISALEDLNYTFQDEGYLFSLITNNLAQSLLPYILSHRIRGVYKRKMIFPGKFGKWELSDDNDLEKELLDDSTFLYQYITNKDFKDNKQLDYPYVVFDEENENAENGITIFDSSVLKILDEYQDLFGADMLGCDITKNELKSWKKRAKKKKNRKKVKKEITEKVEKGTDKFKTDNPLSIFENEKDRLLKGRSSYIDEIIALYENRNTLPLCKYDEDYKDCKCLVNNEIDKDVLKSTKKYDDEFSYSAIGDTDEYYNYYMSILSSINLLNSDDKYSQEYYEIITDIINKRLIVEQCDVKTLQKNFCDLYNENIEDFFKLNKDEKKNTEKKINSEFNKLGLKISDYVKENNHTDLTPYYQAYNYIKSILDSKLTDEDDENDTLAVTLLATMYTYIKSYGDGKNNKYKDIKTDNDKYLYFNLVIEESNKICAFWDKIIALYRLNNMDNCIKQLYDIAYSYNDIALWPDMSEITIDNIKYDHYLFENIYEKEYDDTDDINIGSYDFPDNVPFPEIPDLLDPIDLLWAIDELNNYDLTEPDNPNVISIKHFKYWQKYFSLATLICLPPCFWNCGLDIIPFIQLIPLPCIFIAISSVYIKIFGIIMVFGIAIRGMYPWPIILYVNTTNQPISILTPLLVVILQIKDIMNQKLNNLEEITCKGVVKSMIQMLEADSNNIKKENKKLDTYMEICKSTTFHKLESIKKTFEYVADPSIDHRLRIQRLETILRMNRVK